MKTNISLIAILLMVIMAGCEKETADYRDQFIGKWRGQWEYTTPYYHQDHLYAYRHFIYGFTETEMAVNTNWRDQVVEVWCDSYTFQPFGIASYTTCGNVAVIFTISGSGCIEGDTLKESGTIVFQEENREYLGSWKSWMVKDN